MFTTSFGFPLSSLTILVNLSLTLLSFMTQSNWCNTLLVFLTVLEIRPIPPQDPPERRCLWRLASVSWGDLRRYYADFLWNDYCFRDRDPSLCAERKAEVIESDMEAYIPHSFSRPKPAKPWFNTACSRAIHDREVAHKRYLSLPSPESHVLYTSGRNQAKSILQLAKNSFIHRKCQNLSRYNSPRDFWHLAKNISNNFTSSSFPPLVQPDDTNAISSITKAKLFAQTFC